MKRRSLWKLSVCTPAQSEQAVSDLLESRFDGHATSYTDLETGRTTVSLYLERKPAWSQAARGDLEGALKQIKEGANGSSRLKISLTKLRSQDWAEAWKRHFKPLALGSRLLIKPTWSRRRPAAGQVVVELDPGMSFGTGHHPTTSFCLRELARLRKSMTDQSFLDLGTGSGILSISAAKLGYSPILALDFDPDSIRVARSNARLNHATGKVQFKCRDVTALPKHPIHLYSVVCANLISNLLIAEKNRLVAAVQPRGHLVLAGILGQEFAGIQAAYEALGLRLVRSRTEKEWRSGCFIRTIWD
jgi:ribosomal protein L11 methyltransferase